MLWCFEVSLVQFGFSLKTHFQSCVPPTKPHLPPSTLFLHLHFDVLIHPETDYYPPLKWLTLHFDILADTKHQTATEQAKELED